MKPSAPRNKTPPSAPLRKTVFGNSLKLTRLRTCAVMWVLGIFLASGSVPVWSQEIRAKQEGESTIRVISADRFETTFTKRKGFGATWFDLKHDPQNKHEGYEDKDLRAAWTS